jgi:hypothetical protein
VRLVLASCTSRMLAPARVCTVEVSGTASDLWKKKREEREGTLQAGPTHHGQAQVRPTQRCIYQDAPNEPGLWAAGGWWWGAWHL